jgi:hypothetical protein
MDGQPANPYAAPQTDVNIDRDAEEMADSLSGTRVVRVRR